MNDMDAFERQLATVMQQGGRPSLPVDAMSIARTATATAGRWSDLTRRLGGGHPAPMERGSSTFSAVKFIAAGVFVALFGGFLLAGVLTTQQGDEIAPAAVIVSPSPEAEADVVTEPPTPPPAPKTAGELLSGMVTEEIEPGVYRVINDGVRDLSSRDFWNIVAGHDGSIWILRDKRFYRLGSERSHGWPGGERVVEFEVTPDGTVWTLTGKVVGKGQDERTVTRIRSFDGESWTLRKKMTGTSRANIWSPGLGLTIAPDGSVWAAWADPDGEKKKFGHVPTVIARFGTDAWEPLEQPVESLSGGVGLMVTESGDIWAAHWPDERDEAQPICHGWRLSRYVDDSWQPWQQEGPATGGYGMNVDIAPDGTVWLLGPGLHEGTIDGEPVTATDLRCDDNSDSVLLRFDGSQWQGWDADGKVKENEWASFGADPQGGVWLYGSGSLVHFDGSTWRPLLTDHNFSTGMAVAADGSLWIPATAPGDDWRDGPRHLYVITPEALVATR